MTQASCWDTYEYDDLCNILSDYHKDVMGFRLRMWGEPREAVIAQLVALDEYMAKMKSSEQGRAELRANGFVI